MHKAQISFLVTAAAILAASPSALASSPGKAVPQVLQPARFGVSPPSHTLKSAARASNLAAASSPGASAQAAVPGSSLARSSPLQPAAVTPLLAFQGLDSDDNLAVLGTRFVPASPQGDVGPNHYVQWVNRVFQVFDKTGTPLLPAPLPGNAFWSGFGGPCESDNGGDPFLLYDRFADRWYVQQRTSTNPYRLCLALSTSGDPLGTYYRWEFVIGDHIPDRPSVAFWQDAYYLAFNQLFGGITPAGAGVAALERNAMLAGSSTPTMIYYDLRHVDPRFANIVVAQPLEVPTDNPAPGLFLEWDDSTRFLDMTDSLRIWEFQPDWVNPAASLFGTAGQPNYIVETADLDPKLCYGQPCIPQPSSGEKLSVDPYLAPHAVYDPRQKRLLMAQTVDVDRTDHAGIHWMQLVPADYWGPGLGWGWVVNQQGTFAPDQHHRFAPAIAANLAGTICIAYTVASQTMEPSAALACHSSDDPAGQLGPEILWQPGSGSQDGASAWGAFNRLTVDPDGCGFWANALYGRTTGSLAWSTRVGAFTDASCPQEPRGRVYGLVRETGSWRPIPGASVTAAGPVTSTTLTTWDGRYSLLLPPGRYDITFSALGYTSKTITGQVVSSGQETSLWVSLDRDQRVTIDGYVLGQLRGWPLLARVTLKYQGRTIAETFTDPTTGYYAASVAPGLTYDMEVAPFFRGYRPATRAVTALPSGQTENFFLQEDGNEDYLRCVSQEGLNESFDGDFPPLAWRIVTGGSNRENDWRRNNGWARSNVVPGGSGFAVGADADRAGAGSGPFDAELWTPLVKLPAAPRDLAFDHVFRIKDPGDRGYVDICAEPCTSWTNLLTLSADSSGTQAVSLASFAGQTVRFRFRFVAAEAGWYWYIDNVRTQTPGPSPVADNPTLPCTPVAGTLVFGWVNTVGPDNALGGTVKNLETNKESPIFLVPKSWSSNTGRAFYSLFVPLPGNNPATRTFLARKPGCGSHMTAVTGLPANSTFRLDFTLHPGYVYAYLSLYPTYARLQTGESLNGFYSLSAYFDDNPRPPIHFEFSATPVTTNWPHLSPLAPQLQLRTAPELGASPVIGSATTPVELKPNLVPVEAFGFSLAPSHSFVHWLDLTNPGSWAEMGETAGHVVGATFLPGDPSKILAVMRNPAQLLMIDPATWSVSARSPLTYAGEPTGITASQDGSLYLTTVHLPGCTDSKVWRTPQSLVAELPADVCAADIAFGPDGKLYVVDIANDTLLAVDPNTSNVAVVGPLGIDANYDQGLAFDAANSILYWAAFNASTQQGELRVIDTVTGASTLVGAFPGGAQVDGLAIKPTVSSVCWLSFSPASGSLTDYVNGTVTYSANPSCVPTYGLRQAFLSVVNDNHQQLTQRVCVVRAFDDVPANYSLDLFIHALAGAGITQGVGGGNFDPEGYVTRGSMAVWLLRARFGSLYTPPPCSGIFADVPCSNPLAPWIEDLYSRGITSGCSTNPLRYCPNEPVTRAQMAKFLLKAKEPTGYSPPDCTAYSYITFDDVPCPGGFLVNWITQLAGRYITSGCDYRLYCPNDPVTRAQMAKFVVKNWNIPTCYDFFYP